MEEVTRIFCRQEQESVVENVHKAGRKRNGIVNNAILFGFKGKNRKSACQKGQVLLRQQSRQTTGNSRKQQKATDRYKTRGSSGRAQELKKVFLKKS